LTIDLDVDDSQFCTLHTKQLSMYDVVKIMSERSGSLWLYGHSRMSFASAKVSNPFLKESRSQHLRTDWIFIVPATIHESSRISETSLKPKLILSAVQLRRARIVCGVWIGGKHVHVACSHTWLLSPLLVNDTDVMEGTLPVNWTCFDESSLTQASCYNICNCMPFAGYTMGIVFPIHTTAAIILLAINPRSPAVLILN
jgi:hypothetical protein